MTTPDMKSWGNATITHLSGGCKYHRRRGQEFDLSQLGPEGLCHYAYFTAYPYVLAMLHDVQWDWMTDNPDHVFTQCPALVNPRVIDIYRERDDDGQLHVYVRIDSINDKVNVDGAKECDCPHAGGESHEINQGDGKGFCPAAFAQMFPSLAGFMNGRSNPFLDDPNRCIAVCPDNNNNVTFEIRKESTVSTGETP